MKIFRKKPQTKRTPPPVASANTEDSFYTQENSPAPLDEHSAGHSQQSLRTSRHTPVRRRENSNRAGHQEITFLMLRIIFIPILIVAAFFGLRAVLSLMDGPSQKDVEHWDVNAKIMNGEVGNSSATADAAKPLDKTGFKLRMMQWEQADRYLRAAESLNLRGIDEEAVLRLKQALQSTPDNRAVQKLLLKIYMRNEKYADAIPLCLHLLDQDLRNWDIKMSLLKALQETDQIEAGLVLSGQMLAEQPDNLDLLAFSAYADTAQGNLDRAVEIYDSILKHDAKNFLALKGSAYIYQKRGEWKKAIPYYMELARMDPTPERYRALARCYARQNESGKVAIFLGQAAGLYGGSEVSSWLSDADFDSIRDSVDFRAFTDRMVGSENRKAVEAISHRKVETDLTKEAGKAEANGILTHPDLHLLKPSL